MIRKLLVVSFFCLGFQLVGPTSEAQAWGGWGGGGFGAPAFHGYLGNWIGGSPYGLGRIPTPPYFALHPPVYYSMPVPRTYGYSPYAYPGTVMTPEVCEPMDPEIIENPHVVPMHGSADSESQADSKEDDFAVAPLAIENPYVRTPETTQFANVQIVDEAVSGLEAP